MDILKKSESVLKAHKIVVERMSIERGFEEISSSELESNFSRKIDDLGDDKYKVTLSLAINNPDNTLKIAVSVSGLFEFKGEGQEEIKKDLIEKNTVSILFPYIRTQITLLTAQPNLQPIVIPPININALLENMNDND